VCRKPLCLSAEKDHLSLRWRKSNVAFSWAVIYFGITRPFSNLKNSSYSNRLSLGIIRREENTLWSFAPHDISVILDC